MLTTIAMFVLCFAACCIGILFLLPTMVGPSKDAIRLLAIVRSNREDKRTIGLREQVTTRALGYAHRLRATMGLNDNPEIKRRLIEAGMRNADATDFFFGAQGIGLILGILGASFIPVNTLFWVLTCAVLGFMLPDFWLARAAKKRKERIRKSIPDAVDLLVICVDAGLGLDQALLRVGEELDVSHPDINEEFRRVNLEQRAGTPRLEAWKALADRTRIEEFAAFVTMLTQTDRFGTPILKALASFAEDLRTKRRQLAEEAAAKTKIKIIFPLVVCIFPCIFVVLLAPALISISAGLKAMGGH